MIRIGDEHFALAMPFDSEPTWIADTAKVDSTAEIGLGGVVMNNAIIKEWTIIAHRPVIGNGVVIGELVEIGADFLALSDSMICPDSAPNEKSTNARNIGAGVTIGQGVVLDNAVEIGVGAVIPSQDTIKTIRGFGDKNRTVTIYGCDDGFRLSIGCRIGATIEDIETNVANRTRSNEASASTYEPYLPIFRTIGGVVHEAFKDHESVVNDLRVNRQELGLHNW